MQDNGDDDWMTRYFFTGGTMPSLDLFLYFQEDLCVENVAYVNGLHYSRCLEEWLRRQDQHRRELEPIFKVRLHVACHPLLFMLTCASKCACMGAFIAWPGDPTTSSSSSQACGAERRTETHRWH